MKKDKTEIMPSFDRWTWLLKRTVQRNNWSHLHDDFLTDESYLRELANMMDYVNDESNNVLPNHKVRTSILYNKNPLYDFRQNFAVAMYKRQIANQKDVELVQEMIKRTIWAKEYDIFTWAAFFLKYIVSNKAVTCAIPATTKTNHMHQNMQAMYGLLPNEKTRKNMSQYIKNI